MYVGISQVHITYYPYKFTAGFCAILSIHMSILLATAALTEVHVVSQTHMYIHTFAQGFALTCQMPLLVDTFFHPPAVCHIQVLLFFCCWNMPSWIHSNLTHITNYRPALTLAMDQLLGLRHKKYFMVYHLIEINMQVLKFIIYNHKLIFSTINLPGCIHEIRW